MGLCCARSGTDPLNSVIKLPSYTSWFFLTHRLPSSTYPPPISEIPVRYSTATFNASNMAPAASPKREITGFLAGCRAYKRYLEEGASLTWPSYERVSESWSESYTYLAGIWQVSDRYTLYSLWFRMWMIRLSFIPANSIVAGRTAIKGW